MTKIITLSLGIFLMTFTNVVSAVEAEDWCKCKCKVGNQYKTIYMDGPLADHTNCEEEYPYDSACEANIGGTMFSGYIIKCEEDPVKVRKAQRNQLSLDSIFYLN